MMGSVSFAQPLNKVPVKNSFISEVDRQLTIKKVGVLPATDNVGGLYARYLEEKTKALVKSSHFFDEIAVTGADARRNSDFYERDPVEVKRLANAAGADALLAAQVTKTPQGLTISLSLFMAFDGQLLLQEESANAANFPVADMEKKTGELFGKLVAKIPYRGLILSRQGNRVTMSVGTNDGVRENAILSIEQILAAKRHPKRKFLISTDKEIIGKVRVAKVEETLSFGVIIQEKEAGAVGPDSKVTGLDFVNYADPGGVKAGPNPENELGKDPVSFGSNPKAWIPEAAPSLGRLTVALGLGSLKNSVTIQDISTGSQNSYSSTASLYPSIDLDGELWITPNWFMGARISQGILSFSNPQSGSSPGTLNSNNAHYSLHLGYYFLLQDDFWGPKINVHLGFGRYTLFVDASTPLTFTSAAYSGLYLGGGGSIPVTRDRLWLLDLALDRYVYPTITETPVSSGGASESSVTTFKIGGGYRLTQRFVISAHLGFEFYSSTFTGVGNRSATTQGLNSSQTITNLITGLDYLF
ncbi:MAG: hypothetical protein IT289_09875 [Oligoflexia bacterium]|nr:hypothetical protein [Oligoflexia bacterium]